MGWGWGKGRTGFGAGAREADADDLHGTRGVAGARGDRGQGVDPFDEGPEGGVEADLDGDGGGDFGEEAGGEGGAGARGGRRGFWCFEAHGEEGLVSWRRRDGGGGPGRKEDDVKAAPFLCTPGLAWRGECLSILARASRVPIPWPNGCLPCLSVPWPWAWRTQGPGRDSVVFILVSHYPSGLCVDRKPRPVSSQSLVDRKDVSEVRPRCITVRETHLEIDRLWGREHLPEARRTVIRRLMPGWTTGTWRVSVSLAGSENRASRCRNATERGRRWYALSQMHPKLAYSFIPRLFMGSSLPSVRVGLMAGTWRSKVL